MADAFIIYNEGFNAGLKPDPLLNISEWADKYRVLSQKASAEPGKWRTSRTPYLKEIMDCLSPYSGIERVVFMKGAQIGGTEVGNNFWAISCIYPQGRLCLLCQRWTEQKGHLKPV